MRNVDRTAVLTTAAAKGALAGLAGIVVMTAGEKVEQAITHRPNSYIPARALRGLLGKPTSDRAQPWVWNQAMHWGTGALVGTLAGVWSAIGLRGPEAKVLFGVVRLSFDQTIENATGAGAPPSTWPANEKAIDYLHKAVYALVTTTVADRLVAPVLESRRGTTSH